jgi:acyl-CoA thioester hydrolase
LRLSLRAFMINRSSTAATPNGRGGIPVKKVVFDLPIYTYQIDFAGHVSNIVYVQWMEIGRARLLEEAGLPVHLLVERGVIPVLAGTEIEYRKPLRLGDRVRGEVWLSGLGAASAAIELRFFNSGGDLAASGSHRSAFIDAGSRRPLRIPTEMRAAFEPFLEKRTEVEGEAAAALSRRRSKTDGGASR